MRIVLATPLYPPEIADAAVYAKELARRLSIHHDVTVVAYTHLPEPVSGVTVITIDKQQKRLDRILAFRKAFAQALRSTDAVLAINGISVELPILLTKRPKTVPLIFCLADKSAHKRAGIIERLTSTRANAVFQEVPPHRPEIFPLEPRPEQELSAWEALWETHLTELETSLDHAK